MGAGGKGLVAGEVEAEAATTVGLPTTAETERNARTSAGATSDTDNLQEAWELAVAERLRSAYTDASEAFTDLQGSQKLRKKLADIRDYVPALPLEDDAHNRALFSAYVEGMRHFQNPHLGPPAMDVGVSEAALRIALLQRPELRLYVAGLVHHAADRITALALHKGMAALLEGSGVECTMEAVQAAIARFDSSEALYRDGTLFLDDFARLFNHGKYTVASGPTSERSSSRTPPQSDDSSTTTTTASTLRYNQYKSLKHAKKSLEAVDARARDSARRRRSERMTHTLKARLREQLSFFSAASDRLSFPGHGGDRDRQDVHFKMTASLVPSGQQVSLKLELRAEPGAGPALALAALDPSCTGLLSIEHLRLGLEQCNVGLTTAELHMLAAAYSAPQSHGPRVRWVEMLRDLRGLPPSVLEAGGGDSETQAMRALHEELRYWEAAARKALEGSEQRFTSADELASQLVFSPVGVRRVDSSSVRLYCFVDDPNLTNHVRTHANLVVEPPVHIFFSTVISPSGDETVRIKLTPSENEPKDPPSADHPILDATLVRNLCDACVAKWDRLLGMAANYAAVAGVSVDPICLTKTDFKYTLMSVFKKKEIWLTDRQVDTLIASFPGHDLKDSALKLSKGSSTLCVPDLMMGLLPSLAEPACEKLGKGVAFTNAGGDESDLLSVRCILSGMVFEGYTRLRASLLTSIDGVGGVHADVIAGCIKTCLGIDVSEDQVDWALRYLHAPGDTNVNVSALMNILAASIAAAIADRCRQWTSNN